MQNQQQQQRNLLNSMDNNKNAKHKRITNQEESKQKNNNNNNRDMQQAERKSTRKMNIQRAYRTNADAANKNVKWKLSLEYEADASGSHHTQTLAATIHPLLMEILLST